MSDELKVSMNAAEEESTRLQNASQYFREDYLCPVDDSTISANKNGVKAYADDQNIIALLGNNIDTEAKNIRNLGQKFSEYDTMMSTLWEGGCRYPTISNGK